MAHCRDAEGVVHLAEIELDSLETFMVQTSRESTLPLITQCVSDEGYVDELDFIPHIEVYWVNVDTMPTCIQCVGTR
jgi:hypothetical protein